MENKITVDITLNEDSVEQLSKVINVSLSDKLVDTLKDDINESLDFESKITDWADDYLEERVESVIENSNWFVSAIRDEVEEKIENMDMNEYVDIDDIDYENVARDLLENYSPTIDCSTSNAFTNAVRDAVRYMLLKDSDFVWDIQKSLDKRKQKEIADEVRGEIINNAMDQMRINLRNEFISELQEYSTAVENAKNLLSNENRQIHPMDLD